MKLITNRDTVIPDLKEGYYLRIGKDLYYEILATEMLGNFNLALATSAVPIAVGAQGDFIKFEDIEPRDSKDRSGPLEFYLIVVGIRGPGKVHIKQPAGQVLIGSNEKPDAGVITRRISNWLDPRATMWVEEDSLPQFSLENDTTVPIWATVFVYGMKYAVREVCDENLLQLLRDGAKPSEPIRFGGIPIGKGEF